jgi:hypothetical protein
MRETIADAPLSLFRNSFESTPIRTVTLIQILEAIRTSRYQSQVNTLRRILAHQGKAAYDRAKAHLPAVTFGGTFLPTRGNAYLQQHSGIVHMDLDDLADVAATKQALRTDPHVVYVFVSPSAIGLKAGIHVPIVDDDQGYKHAWHTVRAAYEQQYGVTWDPSGKDVSRLCFVSYDPELSMNLDAEIFDVPLAPPPPTPEPYKEPGPRQPSVEGHGYDPQRDVERAVRTAVQMIQAAPMGTRHHTRLKAAKLLGGYVGAGILPYTEALSTLSRALEGYTENLAGALKTVVDGLAYGESAPFRLSDLEADWQRWMDAHQPAAPSRHDQPSPDDRDAGTLTLPLKPYQGLRIRKAVHRGR